MKPIADTDALKRLRSMLACVPHDAYLVGYGHRDAGNSIKIDDFDLVDCLPPDPEKKLDGLVEAYEKVAEHDLASRWFVCRAFNVLRISVAELSKGTADEGLWYSKKVAPIFATRGIEHILMVGLETATFGLAWATLYRRSPMPFTFEECERSSLLIRAALYEWQRSFLPSRSPGAWSDRFDLPRLKPSALEVAIRAARGETEAEIHEATRMSESAIHARLVEIRGSLGADFRRKLLDRLLGPMPNQSFSPAEDEK